MFGGENLKAQEELEQILLDEAKIEGKNEQLVRLESMAMKMTAAMDGEVVSRSRSNDPMGRYLKQKEKLEKEIAQLQEENERRKEFLTGIIDNLKNKTFIRILYGLYFNGKSAEAIAQELGYCTRNIYFLRDNALATVQKIVDES